MINLHIGGKTPHPDWKILDALPGPHVDYVCNAADLSQFAGSSVGAIYASHVLEHFSYNKEVTAVLSEWRRVLVPGGDLFVSVPDLKVCARLFSSGLCTPEERLYLMRAIMGGQTDEYDFHKTAFYEELLHVFFRQSGYSRFTRIERFGLFDDTSERRVRGELISLNMIAVK